MWGVVFHCRRNLFLEDGAGVCIWSWTDKLSTHVRTLPAVGSSIPANDTSRAQIIHVQRNHPVCPLSHPWALDGSINYLQHTVQNPKTPQCGQVTAAHRPCTAPSQLPSPDFTPAQHHHSTHQHSPALTSTPPPQPLHSTITAH